MRAPVISSLLAVGAGILSAQTKPSVEDILKKVSDTYRAAKDYDIVAEKTDDSGVTHVRTVFRAPDRYRLEAKGPGVDFLLGANVVGETLMVFDGTGTWVYLVTSNQYGLFPLSEMTGPDRSDLRPEATDYYTMWHYRKADELVDKAKLLRDEIIEVGGRWVDCYVLPVPDLGSDTWWVAKSSYRVVRQADNGQSTLFTTIRLNEPLSDGLFNFTPPSGSRELKPDR